MIRLKNERTQRVAVLYENDAWLDDFFKALSARGIPYEPVRMDDAAILLDDPPAFPVVFNRVSPSSYLRGHGPAIAFARSMLDVLAEQGCRVINGTRAFAVETSKVSQLLLLRRLGVATPRTILFNNPHGIVEAAKQLRFPAVLKPDCGGSGAFIRRVTGHDHLVALLDRNELFGPGHVLLLQQEFRSADGTIARTEFVDGELVSAMRVRPVNTYNLCPAERCDRPAADPDEPEPPRVEFEPYPDIAPDAVAQAREIVRGANLDVGGVEFVEDAGGGRTFFDINATSVYRADVCAALGIDALGKLVDFVDRELRKEIAKRGERAWPRRRMQSSSAGA